jgi:hypothetical protein
LKESNSRGKTKPKKPKKSKEIIGARWDFDGNLWRLYDDGTEELIPEKAEDSF